MDHPELRLIHWLYFPKGNKQQLDQVPGSEIYIIAAIYTLKITTPDRQSTSHCLTKQVCICGTHIST